MEQLTQKNQNNSTNNTHQKWPNEVGLINSQPRERSVSTVYPDYRFYFKTALNLQAHLGVVFILFEDKIFWVTYTFTETSEHTIKTHEQIQNWVSTS